MTGAPTRARPAPGRPADNRPPAAPPDDDDWGLPTGAPNKTEIARMKREARAQETPYRHAYPSSPPARSSKPRASARNRSGGGRRSAGPFGPKGSVVKVSGGGSGLFLGMVVYAVGINWLKYGWPGVTGWFAAKFYNQVTLGQAPAAPQTAGGATITPQQQQNAASNWDNGGSALVPVGSGQPQDAVPGARPVVQ